MNWTATTFLEGCAYALFGHGRPIFVERKRNKNFLYRGYLGHIRDTGFEPNCLIKILHMFQNLILIKTPCIPGTKPIS